MKTRAILALSLLSVILGCHDKTHEEKVVEARGTIQNLLDTSVRLEVNSMTNDVITQQRLFIHGIEGDYGTDYTLCGTVRVDHGDHFFIVTMRMANLDTILGEAPVQLLTPEGVADKLTKQFCSNTDADLPPNLEP